MAKGEDLPTMLSSAKKKRSDDDSLPIDVGQKPIQLQRRRVWRACESCRYVRRPTPPISAHLDPVRSPLTLPIPAAKRSSVMDVNQLAHNVLHLVLNALGFRQRIGLHSAGSMLFLPPPLFFSLLTNLSLP